MVITGLLLGTAGCWDDGPVPFDEPLEVLIGSTEFGGGPLAFDFDDADPVPLAFNTEIGGVAIYSATEPGFVPLGPRVVSGPPYGLPTGTTIGMRITAIDPEVQVIFAGALLTAVGDAVILGTSPFDVHPIWQVAIPDGSAPEPYFVSFVLTSDSPQFDESVELTLTLLIDESAEAPPP